ncbi:unknown [Clostridium sp. CAG:354]|nr:hypothetical protein [Clostridium sp.]MEE0268339.1 hypothetical protein [Clostridia bacterium]CDE10545.1 unknown [Clostridium sp. CAG:354]
MEQRSLRVVSTNKNFFTKLTNTISRLLIPTKLGINGIMISIKRSSLVKAFEAYKNETKDEAKKEILSKKYEDAYTLYLEAIDKYIMDSIYKKVKNSTATEFEKDALSNYYEVIHLKQTEYLEYKYKKQQYLLQLDYQTLKSEENKIIPRYERFYSVKIEQLYKGVLKHYSIQLADNLTYQDKNIIYDKIFDLLEDYITEVLPLKLKLDDSNMYKNIISQYEKFDRFTVGKLDIKDTVEKRMILLGISRQLFTHSLPLVVAEQCYVKILKDLRQIIITTKIASKKEAAYKLLIELIEDYNIRLLSTKIYWDKPSDREEYKLFWNEYKKLQKGKEDLEKYEKQKEILFIKADLKKLQAAKRDYSKIIDFYKNKLVELGVMREIKNKCKTSEKIYSRIKRQEKKEIG